MFNPQKTNQNLIIWWFPWLTWPNPYIHPWLPRAEKKTAEMSGPSAPCLERGDLFGLKRQQVFAAVSLLRVDTEPTRSETESWVSGLWMDANDAMFHGLSQFSIIFPVLWKKRESFFHEAALKRFSKCGTSINKWGWQGEKRFKMLKWQLKYLGFSGFIES